MFHLHFLLALSPQLNVLCKLYCALVYHKYLMESLPFHKVIGPLFIFGAINLYIYKILEKLVQEIALD